MTSSGYLRDGGVSSLPGSCGCVDLRAGGRPAYADVSGLPAFGPRPSVDEVDQGSPVAIDKEKRLSARVALVPDRCRAFSRRGRSGQCLDDLQELLAPVAVFSRELQELSGLGQYGAALGAACYSHAVPAAELEQTLFA